VPNFLGATLPRCDQGDREYYCCAMLTLFKPWRTGKELKQCETWDQTFASQFFSERQLQLMNNFNIKYECLDACDDFCAQMKKGVDSDIVGSWLQYDNESEDPIDNSKNEMYPELDEPPESPLQCGERQKRRLKEAAEINAILSRIGWINPCNNVSDIISSFKPDRILSGSQW
ncbi:hypothetical protein CPB84DRAFT_1650027, partial [Gymnopilus junonius]